MKNSTCRSNPTRTPSAAAVSGPAASASIGRLSATRTTRATATTTAGSSSLFHCPPATEPSIQNITPWAARASGPLNTKKLASAENAEDSTTPDRISRNGVSPPCAMVMAYTVAVATSAPISAPPERAYSPRLLKRPNVKTAVAPTLAPDDTPSKYGSASGFRTRVCIATPASDRPAPTINANTPRGARSSHTIESTAWLGPLPP